MKKTVSILMCLILVLTSVIGVTTAVASNSPTIEIEDSVCFAGEQISVKVFIRNNPGFSYLELTPEYSDELVLTNVTNGELISDFTEGKQYIWVSDGDVTDDGVLMTFSFDIPQTASAGNYSVGCVIRACGNYNEDSVDFMVNYGNIQVQSNTVSVTEIKLNETELNLLTGESEALVATVSPDNATDKSIMWASSDENVVTVDTDGTVTAVGKGTATITVTTDDGGFSASCVVSVACSHGTTTDYPSVESTCEIQGNDAYTKCDECGEVISGSDAKLPLADHKGGTATCSHKAVCDVCGVEYGDLGEHNYIEKVDSEYIKSEATCVDEAVYYKSCEVCGIASATETFTNGDVDETKHIGGTFVENQKEATCYEEGYTGDRKCLSCKAVVEYGDTIPAGEHNPADVWSTDEQYHWKECGTVGCGNIIDKTEHSGGTATCNHKAVCDVCGVEYGTVDYSNHVGETEVRNAIAATEEQNGYTGDTYCLDCNQKIGDGQVIPKLPVTDEPTTDEPATDEPSTDEPATDEPTTDEPTTDEPTTDEPTTDEPATDEPTTDEPSTDEPTTDEPTTDESTTDETASDETETENDTASEVEKTEVEDGENTTANTGSKGESRVPKTGDSLSILMLCIVLASSVTGLAVINIFKKKKAMS